MNDRTSSIDARLILVLSLGFAGTLMFGVGLLASFSDLSGLHQALALDWVRVALLAVGGVSMGLEARYLIGWARRRARPR